MLQVEFNKIPKIVKKKMKKTKNSQKFKHYSELPPELRMMIVDEMEPADRCRFGGCSRTSNKDAKSSKKCIYSLEFSSDSSLVEIQVAHGEYDEMDKAKIGFILTFETEHGKKYMKYSNMENKEYWKIDLDKSTSLHNLAFEYFERMLQLHQNKIKKLAIFNMKYEEASRNFNIKSLNNLEVLETFQSEDIIHILPILRRPLKTFEVYEEDNNQLLKNYEFSQVQHCLRLRYFKFDITQYLQLQANEIITHIGEFTEMDIFNFVEGWRNGTIGKHWKWCEWLLQGSKFNIRKLFGFFGIYHRNLSHLRYSFRQYKEDGKFGKLIVNIDSIAFIA